MNLQRIHDLTEQYARWVRRDRRFELGALWETQAQYQQHWSLEVPLAGLPDMYDRALQNYTDRSHWKSDNYYPKEMMLRFAKAYPDMVEATFKDLYNERREIDGRLDRFLYHCDQMLAQYKEDHPHRTDNNHYHTYHTASLYLAMRYPMLYSVYEGRLFEQVLAAVGAKPVAPGIDDVPRYFKVCRTLYRFLAKHDPLLKAHARRLQPDKHYTEESLLLVYDFARWVARS